MTSKKRCTLSHEAKHINLVSIKHPVKIRGIFIMNFLFFVCTKKYMVWSWGLKYLSQTSKPPSKISNGWDSPISQGFLFVFGTHIFGKFHRTTTEPPRTTQGSDDGNDTSPSRAIWPQLFGLKINCWNLNLTQLKRKFIFKSWCFGVLC